MKALRIKSKKFALLRKKAEAWLATQPITELENSPSAYDLLHEVRIHQIELEMQNEQLLLAQSELELSRDLYADLYELSPISYLTLDKNYNILMCNLAAIELLGAERSVLYKKNFLDFLLPASQTFFCQVVQDLAQLKSKKSFELTLLDEKKCRYEVRMEGILTKDGQLRISIMDITDSKLAELKYKEVNNSLRLINNLFQYTNDAIAALSPEFEFLAFNRAFEQKFFTIFAIKVSNGLNLLNILQELPPAQKDLVKAYQQAFADPNHSIIHELNKLTPNYACLQATFSPLVDEKDTYLGLTFSIRDITNHRLNEHKAHKRQTEAAYVARMNTMGELAAAIAHEINQPLTVINAYSQGCLMKLEKDIAELQQLIQILQKVVTHSEYAGNIVHRMKNFMRDGKIYCHKTEVNEFILDTIDLINHELIGAKIALKLELATDLPSILMDSVQIGQVILNLIRNSMEALQNAQTIDPEIIIRSRLHQETIEIHVLDNGPGMPAVWKEKIFHSYFTTKSQGTGLGLAICKTLIEAHNGKLFIESSPNGGTWVYFYLPLSRSTFYADT